MAVRFLIFLTFILAYWVTDTVITPLQDRYITETLFASLIFLPHGVRVLSVWMFREKAVLPLAVAEFVVFLIYWPNIPIVSSALAGFVGGLSAFLGFELIKKLVVDPYADNYHRGQWGTVLVAGILASVFSSFGHTLALWDTVEIIDPVRQQIAFLVGDTMGTLALMVLLMYVLRTLRRYKYHRD